MRTAKTWVLATFILTFFVIIAGGVVRTTQSGMGCPDWPRCFGRWIPPTNASELPADFEKYLSKQDIDHTFNVYHTWIEYFNRLAGALLGVFAIIQLIALFRCRKEKRAAFQFALGFLVTVILTGLFGAIVVKKNLAHLSISVHLLFAVILIQLQLGAWLALKNRIGVIHIDQKLRNCFVVLLVLVAIQSVFGTMVRMYVDDISKHLEYQQREAWLADQPVAFLVHRTFSWTVLAVTLAMAFYCNKNLLVRKKMFLITANILLSMIVGIVLVYADMPAVAQPIHLLLATFVITQLFSVLFQTKTSLLNG